MAKRNKAPNKSTRERAAAKANGSKANGSKANAPKANGSKASGERLQAKSAAAGSNGHANGSSNGHAKANGKQLPVLGEQRKQVPCLSCGLCCDYLAIEINPPTTVYAANEILWQLYHDGVSVYVEDDDWILQIETRCRHLQDDKKCAIYEHRPVICRQYDERTCEINSAEVGQLLYSPQEFLDYLQAHHKRVFSALSKQNVPTDRSNLGVRRARRSTPAFEPRYRKLRELGAAG